MFQMYSSPMFLPQAGMPLALIPCLITQNALATSTLCLLRSGGVGYRPWLNSVSAIDGAKWHPAHMAAYLPARSEEHTFELQSLMSISYAVFCFKKQITTDTC